MKGTKVLREKINTLEEKLEGEKFEDMVKIFIESLYEPSLNGNSYYIQDKKNMDKNLKKFMNTCRKFIRKYANNIKIDYTIDPQKYLLDKDNEDANIYLYIVESLYYFYINHCNSDKAYTNSENKEYTFSKYMYMSVERKIKEENKLYEKFIEKGNMNDNGRFSKIELDATSIEGI